MYNYEKEAVEVFGNIINKSNNQIVFNCPKCKRPKLYVNSCNGLFNCFRCNYKGKLKSKVSLRDIKQNYNKNKLNANSLVDNINDITLIPFTKVKLYDEQIVALKARGITESDIKYYNICGRIQDNRIQIPNYVKGNFTDLVCAWQYDKNKVDDTHPKYLNSEGTKKDKTLFNIYNIEEGANQIILCEGIFNAITAGHNAVASYGCHLSDSQCSLILAKKPKSILIAYDSDEPGVKGALDVIKKLKKNNYFGVVEYVLLPKGIDINDLGRDNFNNYCTSHKIKININNELSTILPKLLFKSRF